MKKLLVSCIVCLCAGVAMGQGSVSSVIKGTQGVAEITQGVGQLGKVTVPLVERKMAAVALGQSQVAGYAMTEAYAAMRKLTPTQHSLLGVHGVAAELDPAVLGVSTEQMAQNSEQMLRAVLVEENSLIVTLAKLLEADMSLAYQYVPTIEEDLARALKPAEGESLAHFAASQLPEEIEYLCIGEENAFMLEGLDTMDKLLTEIRAKFPEREVVVVTSFLPNQKILFPGNENFIPTNDYHTQVWNSALRNQMTVVGADISQRMEGAGFMKVVGDDIQMESVTISTAQTATGQEAQRKHFMRLLNDINRANHSRIENPLYVLYGRPVNMLYGGFASVADDLAKSFLASESKMKVIHLAPTTGVDAAGHLTGRTTKFEEILPPGLGMRVSKVRAMAWAPKSQFSQLLSGTDIFLNMERR